MHKKILVVEDDPDIRECLQEAFEMIGYASHAACNGKEALELLENCELLPCLIILDLMMPIMTGHQFCDLKMANPKFASIPVVVVSADSNVAQKAARLGAHDSITKPVDFAVLIKLTEKYCGPESA